MGLHLEQKMVTKKFGKTALARAAWDRERQTGDELGWFCDGSGER